MKRSAALSCLLTIASFGCGSAVQGGDGGTGGTTSSTTTTGSTTTTTTTDSTTTTTTTSTTTTTTTTTTSSSGGVKPPPPGTHVPPDGSGSVVFAVRRIFFGDANRDGTPNTVNGWKQYGYDLDGDISTSSSTALCMPRNNGSPQQVYPDGNEGIDNSFGRNILPIWLALQPNYSDDQNQAIDDGDYTLLFDLVNLGAGADYGPLASRIHVGAPTATAPQWSGLDAWPVRSDGLSAPPDLGTAKLQVADSYTVGDTWVARFTGELMLSPAGGFLGLPLVIKDPIVTMDLNADHSGASNGTIAGVIPTDAFIGLLKQAVGAFDPVFCEPNNATFQSIANQIAQASDILLDGTQDPTKQCDGISIGLGFDATLVKLGAVVTVPPPVDPCP